MKIESAAFKNGERIPAKFTCTGLEVNPSLKISGVPAGAKSLAIVMDDPDAPGGTWVHWLIWNIKPDTKLIEEGSVPDEAVEGKNSWGRFTYGGPCPPSGSHRYFIRLYALDVVLPEHTSGDIVHLEEAMSGHIIARAELMGTYKRE